MTEPDRVPDHSFAGSTAALSADLAQFADAIENVAHQHLTEREIAHALLRVKEGAGTSVDSIPGDLSSRQLSLAFLLVRYAERLTARLVAS